MSSHMRQIFVPGRRLISVYPSGTLPGAKPNPTWLRAAKNPKMARRASAAEIAEAQGTTNVNRTCSYGAGNEWRTDFHLLLTQGWT
jgi:hypothetical protein